VTRRTLSLFPILALLAGCGRAEHTTAAVAEPVAQAAESSSPSTAATGHAACGSDSTAAHSAGELGCGMAAAEHAAEEGTCGNAEPGGCGACGDTTAVRDQVDRVVDPATGKETLRVGARLSGASPVAVAELLAHPEAYAGKTVRLEGDVAAMCHHRRAWFALQQAGARDGQAVRIFAAPAFLVPPGSVGRRARTEGTVELVDVPASAREHLEAEHGLASPNAPGKSVIVRASGAEFI
jgi:hypothetical protein